ncbi:MAG TPA: protein kinase, partial [Minicystis sp.]|nr:protein kinase [Minicystis sp.]
MAQHEPTRIVDERYALEAKLGEGGMGAVYRAHHLMTGAKVALKLLHPHVAAIPGVAERFQAEARAPAAIGHPGIVKVTDAGVTREGELYLVMELLEGDTLRALVARGPIPLAAIAPLVADALAALGAAHA